jgi:hypothetical protein
MGFESKVLEIIENFSEGNEFAVHAHFYDGTLCAHNVSESTANRLLRTLQYQLDCTIKMSTVDDVSGDDVEYLYDFCAFHGSK